MKKLAIGLASLIFVAPIGAGAASVFNPHLIITDGEMRDYRAMSFSQIYEFLLEKGGFAQCFDVDPMDGLLKGTAQLVDDAAKRYEINPKYILALLQKESGVIESSKPSQKMLDWAAGYALCDGCSKSNTLAQKYKGLGKQIDVGAGWMDWYMDNVTTLTYMIQPGKSAKIDRTSVTPANLVTAALYNYTPHLHGNRLLWSIWNRWWGTDGLEIPDGTLVRNEKTGATALIQAGKFRPITKASIVETRFKSANIIDVNPYDFSELEKNMGRPVKFADLSLIKTEDGSIWLLKGDTKRKIASQEVFAAIGFNPEEVEDAASSDLDDYLEGEEITRDSAYPTGQLVQDKATGGVYYAEAGVKHPLWDKALLAANYKGEKLIKLGADELGGLEVGEPVKFRDGTLVRSTDDATVFVISAGKKLPIMTEETFVAFGYDWDKILFAGQKIIDLHETGEPLSLSE
jgi:hypothetical protein